MTRHRRSCRITSVKMRGGVNTSQQESLPPELNVSDLDISGQSNISEGGIDLQQQQQFANWQNPDYSGDTTIDTIGDITSNTNDLSIGNIEQVNPIEGDDTFLDMDDPNLSIDNSTLNTTMDNSVGGKRRTNKRKSKKARKSKKTKKSRKSKKTRKTRKRRQCGGQGFTTTETTNPIAYKENEYNQMLNDLNYKPSIQ